MVHHLHSDFLDNESRYREAQDFWYALVGKLTKGVAGQRDWRRTTRATFADGVTLVPKDGNPLIEVRSRGQRKKIQVIQWPPESDDLELAAWVSPREEWEGEEVIVWDELTLNLSLSNESAALAEELIGSWIQQDMTSDGMQAIIKNKVG